MTLTTPNRPLLPLLPAHPGGRSAMTCRYRCGNACFHDVPNTSPNEYFGDVLARVVSRRTVLQAGAVVGLVGAAGTTGTLPSAAVQPVGQGAPGLRFSPVTPSTTDAVVVPPGYLHEVVLRWGDPLFKDAPEFDAHDQNAEAQARQFGYNCDFLGLLPRRGRGRFLLVANHEYTNEELMFPDYDPENPSREQVETAWAAHGLSVVALTAERRGRRSGGLDAVVGHRLNRRFTARSEFALSGPVAGHELVRTTSDPDGSTVLGTLNNCAGGLTPWGTWLTGEENFNQYFANAEAVTDPVAAERLRRYGLAEGASDRKWERFDARFDLAKEPNEPNRFGWVCEIDPYDPDSTPRKRTALGRMKHEGATIRLTADGRAAAYMGDDERFDYVYKFVSRDEYREGDHEHNATLLDNGTLYVARFTGDSPGEITGTGALPADGEFDGSGEWIPLATSADGEAESHVEGMTGVEVLIFTRLAGDAVGATKMDRPEDVEPHPQTGRVYMALTNNTNRGLPGYAGPDEANPRRENKHGHVIELRESDDDAASTTFAWRILLLCGDPEDPSTYFDGFDKSQVSPISCPDNVTFDHHGNLWIATDGNALGSNDGLFGVALEGPYRGQVKQFLTVPVGAETCGPWVEDHRVLVHVQHPGEADGSTFDNPLSHWPDGGIPRPSAVVVWRADGREIGSA